MEETMNTLNNYSVKVVASNIRSIRGNLEEKPDKFELIQGICEENDIALFEVLDDFGAYDRIENIYGRSVKIYKGDYIIAAFGNRYSAQNLCGHISGESTDTIFQLLTNGGIVGICDASPVYRKSPLNLKCIGLIAENGEKINLLNLSENITTLPKIVIVCGTSGETGKTTVTKDLIKNLKRNSNYKIAGLKLSGTGCMEDILEHYDAGSDVIYDLCDVGLVSSYSESSRMVSAVKTVLDKAAKDNVDFCVCECGGDIIGGNVFNILKDELIKKNIFNIVLTYNDVMGLLEANNLFKKLGINCKIDVAQNINHNVFGDIYRLKQWNINYTSYDVNYEEEKSKLAKSVLEEFKKQ